MNVQQVHSEQILMEAQKKIRSLASISNEIKNNIVFTKGVFDILHFGHLSLFSYLHALKNDNNCSIVVGITCDVIVKGKKGANRPINPENERALQICLLPQVDYVFINYEADLSKVISTLQPMFFIKGIDTTVGKIDSEFLIEKNPEFNSLDETSTVVIYSDDQSISTSSIIKRIINKS